VIDEKIVARFWERVEKTDGCWYWLQRESIRPHRLRRANLYGTITANRVSYVAHRLSYTLAHGEIPPGMVVRHQCAVPSCVNPDHLLLGTPEENTKDTHARRLRGVPKGQFCTYDEQPGDLLEYTPNTDES
jgi:hypothetical protein